MKNTIVVIGAGNMGVSLISGFIQNGFPPENLWGTDPDEKKLQALKEKFQINTTTVNQHAVEHADVVIFAIKPQVFAKVAKNLKTTIEKHKPLIITIAAGLRIASIENWLGHQLAIVRAMPNTPALISCGATGLFANEQTTKPQRKLAEALLSSVGIAVWTEDEAQMDVVTALSGNGPAYFFLVMEVLQNVAEEMGLTPSVARLLTMQTALGAACMAVESDLSVQELRQKVTSPGGTTEKAIQTLQEGEIHDLFRKALQAAKMRSEELADLMGK